ncbi:hypothetical protein BB560_004702 [Smittium megazygosporum]|uniref:Uncharacterized protein n=1 Tax=Smittium megazygosporum TaxID=133381 RepID=A0A2T9Z8J3_9FUNG|nr:hypothetical protein BB560_004702 [Smittium megazygosporum]
MSSYPIYSSEEYDSSFYTSYVFENLRYINPNSEYIGFSTLSESFVLKISLLSKLPQSLLSLLFPSGISEAVTSDSLDPVNLNPTYIGCNPSLDETKYPGPFLYLPINPQLLEFILSFFNDSTTPSSDSKVDSKLSYVPSIGSNTFEVPEQDNDFSLYNLKSKSTNSASSESKIQNLENSSMKNSCSNSQLVDTSQQTITDDTLSQPDIVPPSSLTKNATLTQHDLLVLEKKGNEPELDPVEFTTSHFSLDDDSELEDIDDDRSYYYADPSLLLDPDYSGKHTPMIMLIEDLDFFIIPSKNSSSNPALSTPPISKLRLDVSEFLLKDSKIFPSILSYIDRLKNTNKRLVYSAHTIPSSSSLQSNDKSSLPASENPSNKENHNVEDHHEPTENNESLLKDDSNIEESALNTQPLENNINTSDNLDSVGSENADLNSNHDENRPPDFSPLSNDSEPIDPSLESQPKHNVFESPLRSVDPGAVENQLVNLLFNCGFSSNSTWSKRSLSLNSFNIKSIKFLPIEKYPSPLSPPALSPLRPESQTSDTLVEPLDKSHIFSFFLKPAIKSWWDNSSIELDDQTKIDLFCKRTWTLEVLLL